MAASPVVHVVASEVHYLDHLAPIWLALPEEQRGPLWLGTKARAVRDRAEFYGIPSSLSPPEEGVALTCSGTDLSRVGKLVPTVFTEHGCGMSWSGASPKSYVGGQRGLARLVTVPNPRAAAQQRKAPGPPVLDLGSEPWLDQWRQRGPIDGPACISFHWDCKVVPETRSAIFAYREALPELAKVMPLIGHAHPRIWPLAKQVYLDAGIEPVKDFAEVMRRASLYIVDVSSTAYEFATLDRPVLSLNLDSYRRKVDHGLRFWDAIPGLQCDSPRDLVDRALEASEDPVEAVWARRRAVSLVFPRNDGKASERAAEGLSRALEPRGWSVETPDGRVRRYPSPVAAQRAAKKLHGRQIFG